MSLLGPDTDGRDADGDHFSFLSPTTRDELVVATRPDNLTDNLNQRRRTPRFKLIRLTMMGQFALESSGLNLCL